MRVEVQTPEDWRVLTDDEGDALVTHVIRAGRGQWIWSATWLTPYAPLELRGLPLRIHVTRVDGSEVCSAPFEGTGAERGVRSVETGAC